MIFAILGAALGVAVALGFVPGLADLVTLAANASMSYADAIAKSVLTHLSAHDPHAGAILGVIVAVALPGLVSFALMIAAKLGVVLRRIAAALIVVGSLASLWFIPLDHALILIGLSLVVALIMLLATGVFVVAPLAGLSSAIATASILAIVHGTNTSIVAGSRALSKLSGFDSPLVWKALMLVVAVAGFAGAAVALVHPPHTL